MGKVTVERARYTILKALQDDEYFLSVLEMAHVALVLRAIHPNCNCKHSAVSNVVNPKAFYRYVGGYTPRFPSSCPCCGSGLLLHGRMKWNCTSCEMTYILPTIECLKCETKMFYFVHPTVQHEMWLSTQLLDNIPDNIMCKVLNFSLFKYRKTRRKVSTSTLNAPQQLQEE